jgi:CBS domain-containing protein
LRLETLGFTRVYDYMPGKMDWLAFDLPTEGRKAGTPRARDVVRRDVPRCQIDERLGDVRDRVRQAGWEHCAVVGERDVLIGSLRGESWEADPDARIGAIMREGPTTVRPSEDLEALVGRMQKRSVPQIYVCSSDGVLIGILLRKDGEEWLERGTGH